MAQNVDDVLACLSGIAYCLPFDPSIPLASLEDRGMQAS